MPDYNPWGTPIFPDSAAFGTGSPAETSTQPSGLHSLFSGAFGMLGDLAKRAIGNSQYSLDTGNYNPAPTLGAAMLPMGTGAFAGVPLRGGEFALGSGAVWPTMKQPTELFHVVGPEYKAGDPLRSLYARKGNAAYDEYAARWPEAGDLVQYHPHQNFFYDNLADAQMHADSFGGNILKIDPQKVGGLKFDKNEGFWTTREDVPAGAFLDPFGKSNSATAGIGPASGALGIKDAAEARPGIRAYHGSPHDFDAFDLSKIGTGEGAQAYGHGLYFADNEGVAKSYRDALSGNPGNFGLKAKEGAPPELEGVLKDVWKQTGASSYDDAIKRLGAMRDQAMAKANASFESGLSVKEAERQYSLASQVALQHEDRIRYLLSNQEHLAPHTGKMYEVNINAEPEHFLDWDKPLSQQSPKVQETLKTAMGPNWDQFKSADAGTAIKNGFIAPSAEGTAGSLSGIPGIKYLDQGSRAGGMPTAIDALEGGKWRVTLADRNNGITTRHTFENEDAARAFAKSQENETHNYVVFNDKLIDILKKYAIPGMMAPIFPQVMGEQKS